MTTSSTFPFAGPDESANRVADLPPITGHTDLLLSPDGKWSWNGQTWVAVEQGQVDPVAPLQVPHQPLLPDVTSSTSGLPGESSAASTPDGAWSLRRCLLVGATATLLLFTIFDFISLPNVVTIPLKVGAWLLPMSRMPRLNVLRFGAFFLTALATFVVAVGIVSPVVFLGILGYKSITWVPSLSNAAEVLGQVTLAAVVLAVLRRDVRDRLRASVMPGHVEPLPALACMALAATAVWSLHFLPVGGLGVYVTPHYSPVTSGSSVGSSYYQQCVAAKTQQYGADATANGFGPSASTVAHNMAVADCQIGPAYNSVTGGTSQTGTSDNTSDTPEVTVPDVTGDTLCEAQQTLESAGVQVSATTAGQCNDVVTGEDPAPGSTVDQGTSISLDLN